MTLGAYGAVVALAGSVVFAGWVAFGTGDGSESAGSLVARADTGGVTVIRKTPPPLPSASLSERLQPFEAALRAPPNELPPSASPVMAFAATEPVPTGLRGALRAAPAPDPRKFAREISSDASGVLTATQIAKLKDFLGLTPEQEQHWPAVEAELRGISRRLAASSQDDKPAKLDAVTLQRLYITSGPLILSLRDDQKRALRTLARIMGLGQLASLI